MLGTGTYLAIDLILYLALKNQRYADKEAELERLQNEYDRLAAIAQPLYEHLANTSYITYPQDDPGAWGVHQDCFDRITRIFWYCNYPLQWKCGFEAMAQPTPICPQEIFPGDIVELPDGCQPTLDQWCDLVPSLRATIPDLHVITDFLANFNSNDYNEHYRWAGNALFFYGFFLIYGELTPLVIIFLNTLMAAYDNCFSSCVKLDAAGQDELLRIKNDHHVDVPHNSLKIFKNLLQETEKSLDQYRKTRLLFEFGAKPKNEFTLDKRDPNRLHSFFKTVNQMPQADKQRLMRNIYEFAGVVPVKAPRPS